MLTGKIRISKKLLPYIVSLFVGFSVRILVYKRNLFNYKKKKVLIYTDSRGFFVGCWYCKKTPLYTYILKLSENYRVYYKICPHKHTTLLDFLHDKKAHSLIVDAVVLHTGVVDYSPRPAEQAKTLSREKSRIVASLFGKEGLGSFKLRTYDEVYNGERTSSLYSKEFLKNYILPAVVSLGVPVVWVGVNRVLTGWRGSYFRDRPKNINYILEYQKVIDGFEGVNNINLNFSDNEIRKYTVDNIHLSKIGFSYLYYRVNSELDEVLKCQD